MTKQNIAPCTVNVASETGRLRAVLLHRPGPEIERMTPLNAAHALYSDILNKPLVDTEYHYFSDVLERWTQVYYVEDILARLLDQPDVRRHLVEESCDMDNCYDGLAAELLELPSDELARTLIQGYEKPDWDCVSDERYLLKPLYNLFFTRDASSSVYNEVLINSMSFKVRQRETLIYRTIFENYFNTKTFCAMDANPNARTEGGDVQIASPDLLCLGMGIRTNFKGIKYLADKFGGEREHFRILVQELPHKPDSFIHLDMVFTFLGSRQCMVYQPMLDKSGIFSGKATTLIELDNGKMKVTECSNMLEGLKACGMDMEPVFCGGSDSWYQDREQWHSGANFFALGDGKVIGYERNVNTIESLDKAGFSVLDADDVCSGKIDMNDYEKFVVTFKASELPRAGGGARCMTMPINRD